MSVLKPHDNYFLRRYIIVMLTTLGGISLFGCAGADEATTNLPEEAVAVSFHAALESAMQSRATSMDLSTLKTEGFGVLAYYTNGTSWSNAYTPNFMYNQKVNWNVDRWTYSPIKYWPIVPNDKVSFFAYAPYDDQLAGTLTDNNGITLSGNGVIGSPTIGFTVNSVIADQVDLIYASAIDKNTEMVNFNFKHALSRIGFSAKTVGNQRGATVKVTALSIKGNFYPSGTFNLSDGYWSGKTSTADSTTYTPQLNSIANAIDSIVQPIHDGDQYLMVIPQNFEEVNNRCVIEVTYTIGTSVKTITEYINVNFEQSKAYNIGLIINVEETGYGISTEVIPWGLINMQRDFSGFVKSGDLWIPASREVSYNDVSLRFLFRMDQPVGGHWVATLGNGLDFALDQSFALDGSSGHDYTIGIKALKPAGKTDRITEFYLTVDGKEVDINGDGSTGKGHRYVITQKAAP